MEFNYVVPNTVEGMIKTQSQVSKRTFPVWVNAASYLIIFLSVAIMTYGLAQLFRPLISRLTGLEDGLLSFLPAIFIAYQVTMRVVVHKANEFFMRFARFDVDFEYTSRFTINETGLTIDEGDRVTQMVWSAIGGVFETKDYLAFYCRGLVYTIPAELLEGDNRASLFATCKAWQAAAQGHRTAKAFI